MKAHAKVMRDARREKNDGRQKGYMVERTKLYKYGRCQDRSSPDSRTPGATEAEFKALAEKWGVEYRGASLSELQLIPGARLPTDASVGAMKERKQKTNRLPENLAYAAARMKLSRTLGSTHEDFKRLADEHGKKWRKGKLPTVESLEEMRRQKKKSNDRRRKN